MERAKRRDVEHALASGPGGRQPPGPEITTQRTRAGGDPGLHTAIECGMLSGMRAIVLAVWLAGCTISGESRRPAAPAQPTADTMPSAVLDRQDPGADTSRNPELSRSSSRSLLDDLLGGLSPRNTPPPAFGGATEAPHYYKGCRGCSTQHPGGLAAVAVAAGLGLRRRRRNTRS